MTPDIPLRLLAAALPLVRAPRLDAAARRPSVVVILADDLGAGQQPERVRQLAGQWEAWAKRVGVPPWDLIRAARRIRT